jgi:hypothetical protein
MPCATVAAAVEQSDKIVIASSGILPSPRGGVLSLVAMIHSVTVMSGQALGDVAALPRAAFVDMRDIRRYQFSLLLALRQISHDAKMPR